MIMAKTALVLWTNTVLKCQDVVLSKIKASISLESMAELCNASLCLNRAVSFVSGH